MATLTRLIEGIITMIFMLFVLYIILLGRAENTGPEIIAGLDLFEIIVMVFMFVVGLYQRRISILQSGNTGKLDQLIKNLHENTEKDNFRDARINKMEMGFDNHEIRIKKLEDNFGANKKPKNKG